MANLEQRVEKLEDSMKSLSSLPSQLEMLIGLTKEANADAKELTRHITETYASKELCSEKHKNVTEGIQEFKDFRKWVWTALVLGAFTGILELTKYIGGK